MKKLMIIGIICLSYAGFSGINQANAKTNDIKTSASKLASTKTKNANQAFQIKTIQPINIYNNIYFTGKKYGHVQKNKIVNIQRIDKYKGFTRFQTESGHFITSNKYFVKIIK